MLLIAAAASMMRGERYIHEDAVETPAQALAHEGAAAAVPATPGEDTAYEDALAPSLGLIFS